jgi:acyl-CoA reductase-like NAD-dependent aldehyde dehydrogenase
MLVLRRFHDLVYERRAEIADVIRRETDKPVAEAMTTEIGVVLDEALFLSRAVPRAVRAPWFGSGSLALGRKRLRVTHEPYGVVAIIAPWNYPLALACARLLPALATGNAVVFKPSELTPSTGELTRQLLIDAGIPADVVGLVQGDGTTGAALAAAPVDKVFFTGSVASGRAVALSCASRLVPCGLELGGSDAAIVLADANPAHAASGLAWGRFSNAGQTCIAPKRVFVEAAVYEPFVRELTRVVLQLRAGAGADETTDVGAMIRPEFRAVLEAQRDDAIARGARVAAVADAGNAAVFPPTVLVDVPPDARAMREETFGPLMTVIRVADADDAIARANATEFGLSASIWSRDVARAAKLAVRLDCGAVAINDVLVTAGAPELPHGGVKQSGMGRAHGMEGVTDCMRTKGIISDRFPSWRQAWWFGYSREFGEGADAFLTLAHSRSVIARLAAIPKVLRLLLRPDRPV